ncbi:hypothetical protein FLP10_11170 [Agromyces intestinalis]|uniref:Uncharacterized protein n=1 Tax=Agromyces intestinalis TaxID=2592652 RepID=A0A5C1YJC9_9MICO|nr:hypothetical protein [Agromyces intestinalis]QEO14912.1 hypothetical protein FLP10_11170 [Agromyces intestinalis]
MSSDPITIPARSHVAMRSVAGAARPPADPILAAERRRLLADVLALELRLAIIDDRFDRLACRPEAPYREWRRDTVDRAEALAARASRLAAAGALTVGDRSRAGALLVGLRERIARLDARHAAYQRRLRTA